jgi:hypothetical protein
VAAGVGKQQPTAWVGPSTGGAPPIHQSSGRYGVPAAINLISLKVSASSGKEGEPGQRLGTMVSGSEPQTPSRPDG